MGEFCAEFQQVLVDEEPYMKIVDLLLRKGLFFDEEKERKSLHLTSSAQKAYKT